MNESAGVLRPRHLLRAFDLGPEELAAIIGGDGGGGGGGDGCGSAVDWNRPIWCRMDEDRWHVEASVRAVAGERGGITEHVTWHELWQLCHPPPHEPAVADAEPPRRAPLALVVGAPDHGRLEALARHSPVPVLNAGTSTHDPLTAMGDLAALHHVLGRLAGLTLLVVGVGPPLRRSWSEAAVLAGMHVVIADAGVAGIPPDLHDAVAYTAMFGASIRPATSLEDDLRAADAAVIGDGVSPELLRAARPGTIVVPATLTFEPRPSGIIRSGVPQALGPLRLLGLQRVMSAVLERQQGARERFDG